MQRMKAELHKAEAEIVELKKSTSRGSFMALDTVLEKLRS